jgi:hypothetical protein
MSSILYPRFEPLRNESFSCDYLFIRNNITIFFFELNMKLKLAFLSPLIATVLAEFNATSINRLNETACLTEHGPGFTPHEVLRITLNDTFTVGCQTRASVLVNGTSPGPPIRIEPGKTTWIRVYNDMETDNFTMARAPNHPIDISHVLTFSSIGTASARGSLHFQMALHPYRSGL